MSTNFTRKSSGFGLISSPDLNAKLQESAALVSPERTTLRPGWQYDDGNEHASYQLSRRDTHPPDPKPPSEQPADHYTNVPHIYQFHEPTSLDRLTA
ncbi:hypothetical protein LTR12_015608 [Friedmanniomyces endolithicus]|nr:hypothetical protein LTR12_015608 [Friedmanniomyces endolithicus]